MSESVPPHIAQKLLDLQSRLDEAEQFIDAIKSGEVDAFAFRSNNIPEVYTLQSGDYAYRVLIEEIDEGGINVTEEGMVVYSNDYFLKLLNLQYDQVVGRSIFDFVDGASKDLFKKMFHESRQGKSKGEINLFVNGKVLPVYVSLTSLQPKLATVGIIISDLSYKKMHENIILEYQKDLERKNLELMQSNAELASFAYIASHDLQEPLRKIQAFIGRILDSEAASLTEKGKDYFSRVQSAAVRMQALIDDLLAYSRTSTLDKNFARSDLGRIFHEVKDLLQDELDQKKATMDISVDCQVDIIPFQFRQMVINIVTNSLKFSKEGKPLHIKVNSRIADAAELGFEKLFPEKKYCHLSISDDGIGFEQKYSEKIFELFQRLHGKNGYPGTGIGLAIVKRIIENHHGFIEAKAEVDMGATFNIYIPATLN
jgi:PAS domain S-box-containing protein